ncbi:MAG: molybdenum cofactor biosynthesis protein MoaE [Verrucomicrobiales bacterium]
MERWLSIQQDPINEAALIQSRKVDYGMGAVITFLGTVRVMEGEQKIGGIEYDAFEKMAVHQFNLLFDRIAAQWPIQSIRLIHRVGWVPVAEASLWVEVHSPHRAEAFAACQYLIDEMKKVVPIWKKPAAELKK